MKRTASTDIIPDWGITCRPQLGTRVIKALGLDSGIIENAAMLFQRVIFPPVRVKDYHQHLRGSGSRMGDISHGS